MRIISGKYRGKVLASFDAENVRPTLDRVKEAVFSKLQFRLIDSEVLDLFGGTGNLGLEAYSRGAHVTIVDSDRRSIDIIRKNASSIDFTGDIMFMDYLEALDKLQKNGKKFDIIFVDPPYSLGLGEKAVESILDKNLLQEDGVIVFEHLKENPFYLSKNGYTVCDEKFYGIVAISYICGV